MSKTFRSGFVALIGRPNVGKSTLINYLVGEKISITSRRPQTTRNRILGISTTENTQAIYIDTPGLHNPRGGSLLNRTMNRAARSSLDGVDCAVMLISAQRWTDEDETVALALKGARFPVFLAINKIDRIKDRKRILALIDESRAKFSFDDIFPISARTGLNVSALSNAINDRLSPHPPFYPAEQVRDRSDSFFAAELIREQIFRAFGEELPYASAVEIEEFTREANLLRIEAVIWVEREGQKAIIVGQQGGKLKEIGRRSRLEMQKAFRSKVYLGLWVKKRTKWSEDARILQRLGYTDTS